MKEGANVRRCSSFRGDGPRRAVHPRLEEAVARRLRADEARALGLPLSDMETEGSPTPRVRKPARAKDARRWLW